MTARPAPTDIVGTLAYLADRIDELAAERGAIRYCAAHAAEKLGYQPCHFYGKPWRIPTFGLEFDREYTLDEWRDWLKRPEAERRAEWDAMPVRDRRLARGAA